jgi:1,4-alpha-glucan branching enzyme
VVEALTTPNDADRNLLAVAEALAEGYNGDAFHRVIYTESHDEVANGKSRVAEEIMPGAAHSYYAKKRTTLGAALVLTAPGIPMLFQGQEFLADGEFNDAEPLQWADVNARPGLVNLYRDLIALRRNFRGLTRGLGGQHTRVFHVNNEQKLVAFARWADGDGGPRDTTLVIANFANETRDNYTIGLPAPGHWTVRFNSDWKGYDGEFSDFDSFGLDAQEGEYDGYAWHGNIGVAPYAVLILSQNS